MDMKSKSLILGTALVVAGISAAPALARDRNGDGLPDRWEHRYHLSLQVDQSKRDQDHDGLNNRGEYSNSSSPRNDDTDSDGLEDGFEVHHGSDPSDDDSNDDGISDGNDVSGSVRSFDQAAGVLVVDTADGRRLTGAVSSTTRITCDDASVSSQRSQGQDDPPGSDPSGGGSSGQACDATHLVTGAKIHEAELEDGAWRKVELAA